MRNRKVEHLARKAWRARACARPLKRASMRSTLTPCAPAGISCDKTVASREGVGSTSSCRPAPAVSGRHPCKCHIAPAVLSEHLPHVSGARYGSGQDAMNLTPRRTSMQPPVFLNVERNNSCRRHSDPSNMTAAQLRPSSEQPSRAAADLVPHRSRISSKQNLHRRPVPSPPRRRVQWIWSPAKLSENGRLQTSQ